MAIASTLLAASIVEGSMYSSPLYISAGVSANYLEVKKDHNLQKYNSGIASTFALGYHLTDSSRIEGEVGYRENDLNYYRQKYHDYRGKADYKKYRPNYTRNAVTMMVNAYSDFNINFPLVPYLGLGAGYSYKGSYGKRKVTDFKKENSQFAGQGIAGVKLLLTTNLNLAMEYRYFLCKSSKYEQSVGLLLSYNL